MQLNITGIKSTENGALVFFDIQDGDKVYHWHDYAPGGDVTEYIQGREQIYFDYVTKKQAEHAAMDKIEIIDGEEYQISELEIVKAPSPGYAALRAKAYPPITDYIDGVIKNDIKQVEKYITDCLAVKAAFPKDY